MKRIKVFYQNCPETIRASFWFTFCAFLQRGISMLSSPVFTRIMPTAEYGRFGTFSQWLSIITIVASFNLFSGVHMQGLVKFEDDLDLFSSSIQGLSTTLTLFWFAIYALFHNFWNRLLSFSTFEMVSVFILVWTASEFNYWANEKKVKFDYKSLVILTVIMSIAKPVVEILFVIFSDSKFLARVFGWVICEIIGYSWIFFYQLFKRKSFYSKKYWKYALIYNAPLIPHFLSQVVLNGSDRIMIESMIGPSESGIYGLAYSLASILVLLNTSLSQVLTPWFYRKIKNNDFSDLENVSYLSLYIIAVSNLLLMLFGPEIVAIFAPKEYSQAIWVIPPVSMGVYFMYSYDIFAKFAMYKGETFLLTISSVFVALTNVLANYLLMKKFGFLVAGFTTLFCYILYCVIHYQIMCLVCDKYYDGLRPFNMKKYIIFSVLFTFLGFIILATYRYSNIRFFIILVLLLSLVILRKHIISILQHIIEIKKT